MNTSTRVEFGLYDVTARSDSAPVTEDAKDFCNLSKDALHNIKGRFLLSYNDCPQVRELYADCIIEPVSRRNTLSAQSVDGYKEVLVRNYEL